MGAKRHKKSGSKTAKTIGDFLKDSSGALQRGTHEHGDIAKAMRTLRDARRLTREELDRAATI